jgi:hypothetical protein
MKEERPPIRMCTLIPVHTTGQVGSSGESSHTVHSGSGDTETASVV